tara:strand:+ start:215908 stop:217770 length:1863 start_codon:yes stop_codon:yes gene_type:complete
MFVKDKYKYVYGEKVDNFYYSEEIKSIKKELVSLAIAGDITRFRNKYEEYSEVAKKSGFLLTSLLQEVDQYGIRGETDLRIVNNEAFNVRSKLYSFIAVNEDETIVFVPEDFKGITSEEVKLKIPSGLPVVFYKVNNIKKLTLSYEDEDFYNHDGILKTSILSTIDNYIKQSVFFIECSGLKELTTENIREGYIYHAGCEIEDVFHIGMQKCYLEFLENDLRKVSVFSLYESNLTFINNNISKEESFLHNSVNIIGLFRQVLLFQNKVKSIAVHLNPKTHSVYLFDNNINKIQLTTKQYTYLDKNIRFNDYINTDSDIEYKLCIDNAKPFDELLPYTQVSFDLNFNLINKDQERINVKAKTVIFRNSILIIEQEGEQSLYELELYKLKTFKISKQFLDSIEEDVAHELRIDELHLNTREIILLENTFRKLKKICDKSGYRHGRNLFQSLETKASIYSIKDKRNIDYILGRSAIFFNDLGVGIYKPIKVLILIFVLSFIYNFSLNNPIVNTYSLRPNVVCYTSLEDTLVKGRDTCGLSGKKLDEYYDKVKTKNKLKERLKNSIRLSIVTTFPFVKLSILSDVVRSRSFLGVVINAFFSLLSAINIYLFVMGVKNRFSIDLK